MSAASGEAGRKMQTFGGGATRTDDSVRDDPEGYLSPLAVERYCRYMTKHRVQADGAVRDSDNWQRGIPPARAWKGLWRHFLHGWMRWRGFEPEDQQSADDIEEDLCAMMFNIQVLLHERLKVKLEPQPNVDWSVSPHADVRDDYGA